MRAFGDSSLSRISLWRVCGTVLLLICAMAIATALVFGMPGFSHFGDLPPLDEGQQATAERLQKHVAAIASGPHHVGAPAALAASAAYIETELAALGHSVHSQHYTTREGDRVRNLEIIIPGGSQPAETIVIGAHYDSTRDGPGANDNASGAAALIELARRLLDHKPARGLRLVWFVNEEPPFFQGDDMGSMRYAKAAKSRPSEQVVAMLSLETLGYYVDAANSQGYPHKLMRMFYPDAGNFVAFVGNWKSRQLVRDSIAAFRSSTPFPSQGLALPDDMPALAHLSDPLGYSDHWSFWQVGVPAIMVTDTAFMRYPRYHTPQDTAERLDYAAMARVTHGVAEVVRILAAR